MGRFNPDATAQDTSPHTRPDDWSADAERSVSAVHPRIVRREAPNSRPAVRKTSRVIQVLLSSASTTMRFTSALDISREKPQFACHCFSIVRRRFSTRRMRSARVCSAFCKDRKLRTNQRSVRHVPDFHHAVCRFCLHPADRFLLCFPFFLHSFLLTGSDLPRGLKKQDFRSFLLCNYGIMNAQTERQCYLA